MLEVTKLCLFRWEFRTEDFDIGFGVSRKVKKGEEEVLLPLQRVNSQLVTEEGYLVCTEPGTCEYYSGSLFSNILVHSHW